MEREDYVEALRRDGARLAATARGSLDQPVAACPDWDVAALVAHVANVHAFFGSLAAGDIDDPRSFVPPTVPEEDELVDWFARGVDDLADVLEGLAPTAEVWTWSSDQTAGFVQRRMAQETAMHCWDAMAAAGAAEPIEAALAVDGVDEFLHQFLGHTDADHSGPVTTVHLHATDAEGEWLATVGDGACTVERAHAKGDVALRGSASDLLLALWRRRTVDETGFEVFGDRAVLDHFIDRTRN